MMPFCLTSVFACVFRTLGLHIRSIEENSRSERERLFQEDECIVQINDIELIDKSFAQWVSDSFICHTFIVVRWITNHPPALFLSTSFPSSLSIFCVIFTFVQLLSILLAHSVQTFYQSILSIHLFLSCRVSVLQLKHNKRKWYFLAASVELPY